MKRCPKCKREDALFSRNASRKDGLADWCKVCHAENKRSGPSRRPKMTKERAAWIEAHREIYDSWIESERLLALNDRPPGSTRNRPLKK